MGFPVAAVSKERSLTRPISSFVGAYAARRRAGVRGSARASTQVKNALSVIQRGGSVGLVHDVEELHPLQRVFDRDGDLLRQRRLVWNAGAPVDGRQDVSHGQFGKGALEEIAASGAAVGADDPGLREQLKV